MSLPDATTDRGIRKDLPGALDRDPDVRVHGLQNGTGSRGLFDELGKLLRGGKWLCEVLQHPLNRTVLQKRTANVLKGFEHSSDALLFGPLDFLPSLCHLDSQRILRNEQLHLFWQGVGLQLLCLLTHLGRKRRVSHQLLHLLFEAVALGHGRHPRGALQFHSAEFTGHTAAQQATNLVEFQALQGVALHDFRPRWQPCWR
ncbi:MAG: hypothetical protein IPH55_00070 [Betaproteobacteria bacterium]|nr:hypothetical protein [Betaproteobacteria bacterium]